MLKRKLAGIVGALGIIISMAAPSQADNYVSIALGWSTPSSFDDASIRTTQDPIINTYTGEYKTSPVLRAALGRYFTPNFRAELEFAHRSTDFTNTIGGFSGLLPVPVTGSSVDATSIMITGYYSRELGVSRGARYFFGGGFGLAKLDIDLQRSDFNFVLSQGSDNRTAGMLRAGIEKDLAMGKTIFADLTYFKTFGDFYTALNETLGSTTPQRLPYEMFEVGFGMRFKF